MTKKYDIIAINNGATMPAKIHFREMAKEKTWRM